MMDRIEQTKQWFRAHKRAVWGTTIIFLVLTALGWTVEYTHSLGAPLLFYHEIDVSPMIDCIQAPCPSVEPDYEPAYGPGLSLLLMAIDVAVAAGIYQIMNTIRTYRDRIMAIDQRLLGLGALALIFVTLGISWELQATTIANSRFLAVMPAIDTFTAIGAFLTSPYQVFGPVGLGITGAGWAIAVVLVTDIRTGWGDRQIWPALTSIIFLGYTGMVSYGIVVDQASIITLASIPPLFIGQVLLRTAGLPIQHAVPVGLVMLYLFILGLGKTISALYQRARTRSIRKEE